MLCQRGPVRLAFHPNRSRQRPLPGDIGSPCIYLSRRGLVHSLVALPCLGCSWFAYISSIRGHWKTKTPPTICHWHQRSWAFEAGSQGRHLGVEGTLGDCRAPATPGGTSAACPTPADGGQTGKGPALTKTRFPQKKPKVRIFIGKFFICRRFEGYTPFTGRSPFAPARSGSVIHIRRPTDKDSSWLYPALTMTSHVAKHLTWSILLKCHNQLKSEKQLFPFTHEKTESER